jgi:hypothetical protein
MSLEDTEYYATILSNKFINETDIPIVYITEPKILEIIKKFNWNIINYKNNGWATFKRKISYNS